MIVTCFDPQDLDHVSHITEIESESEDELLQTPTPKEEVEAHVVEWIEVKEVKRAEIHSLVVANRALRSGCGEAASSFFMGELFEELSRGLNLKSR